MALVKKGFSIYFLIVLDNRMSINVLIRDLNAALRRYLSDIRIFILCDCSGNGSMRKV
jgi:hypothetical protein